MSMQHADTPADKPERKAKDREPSPPPRVATTASSLTIARADDPLEHEADTMATEVVDALRQSTGTVARTVDRSVGRSEQRRGGAAASTIGRMPLRAKGTIFRKIDPDIAPATIIQFEVLRSHYDKDWGSTLVEVRALDDNSTINLMPRSFDQYDVVSAPVPKP